jgi:HAD superfamily hydrolase (TIGR01549 family)
VLKACAFDLGNTLVDDTGLLHETVDAMADWLWEKQLITGKTCFRDIYLQINRQSNVPFVSHTFGEESFFAEAFERLGISALEPSQALEVYRRLLMSRLRIDQDVRYGLELIRGRSMRTALVTNETTVRVNAFFEKTRLRECFDVVVVSEEAGHEKPHPEIFQLTADRLGVRGDELAMFGDTEVADGACKRLGNLFVLVTGFKKSDWGWEQGAPYDPDFVIERVRPDSLLQFLRFAESQRQLP